LTVEYVAVRFFFRALMRKAMPSVFFFFAAIEVSCFL